jgi:hypothetical protein
MSRVEELERQVDALKGKLEDAELRLTEPYYCVTYEEEYDELVEAVLDLERGIFTLDDVLAKVNRRWAVAR